MLTLVEGVLKFDENQYVADTTYDFKLKAVTETEGCTCNIASFKTIRITQKASGEVQGCGPGEDTLPDGSCKPVSGECSSFTQTITDNNDPNTITYAATAGNQYTVKDFASPANSYFTNSNSEGCPITYSLVNHIGEPLGEQTMLILDGSVLKFDENQYVADSI